MPNRLSGCRPAFSGEGSGRFQEPYRVSALVEKSGQLSGSADKTGDRGYPLSRKPSPRTVSSPADAVRSAAPPLFQCAPVESILIVMRRSCASEVIACHHEGIW